MYALSASGLAMHGVLRLFQRRRKLAFGQVAIVAKAYRVTFGLDDLPHEAFLAWPAVVFAFEVDDGKSRFWKRNLIR